MTSSRLGIRNWLLEEVSWRECAPGKGGNEFAVSEEEEEAPCGQSNGMMVQMRTGSGGGGQGAGHESLCGMWF